MFDVNNTKINFTHQQQPNDAADAARLYGEILEKSRSQIVAEIPVKNNIIHDVRMILTKEVGPMGFGLMAHWAFSINEKRIDGNVRVDMGYEGSGLDIAVRSIYDEISKQIAQTLFEASNIAELASMEGKWK